MKHLTHPRGYAALISVVMVMLTVTAIGFTLTVLSADSFLSTLRFNSGITAQALADTCAYEAAVQVRDQGLGYVGTHTLTFDTDSCTINVTNTSGAIVEIAIAVQHDSYQRLVNMTIDTNDKAMLLWQEVSD